ncbi:MAG: hypothetical protein K0U86_00385 [Planctomycetes bacterium]|nr:hypothetical protein [Planctomycetota bacterium]MCH9723343.1 hypothetical protein [Planctomycetota bacterium]MCH9779082.1 hypothetical protein [Planctomycetota bacterium]MCH9789695.1 hypothetical protein [Planctomycetota bacterium]MDF1742260.1 hypothetical protein [Gimesia sp.]
MIEKVADDSFRLMYLPRLILTLFCVVLLTMSGCGDGHPKRSAVTGTVSYNGKPLSIGSLVFIPVGGGPSAQGKVDRNGFYEMGTYDDDDGVIPGDYKIMITALTSPGGSGLPEDAVDGNAGPVSVIPEWYGDLEKSGLRVTVVADKANTIDFPLTDDKPKEPVTK